MQSKSYVPVVILFAVTIGAVILGNMVYAEWINKPKIAPPDTTKVPAQ